MSFASQKHNSNVYIVDNSHGSFDNPNFARDSELPGFSDGINTVDSGVQPVAATPAADVNSPEPSPTVSLPAAPVPPAFDNRAFRVDSAVDLSSNGKAADRAKAKKKKNGDGGGGDSSKQSSCCSRKRCLVATAIAVVLAVLVGVGLGIGLGLGLKAKGGKNKKTHDNTCPVLLTFLHV